MENLPLVHSDGELIVSHAAINPVLGIEGSMEIGRDAWSFSLRNCVLWNPGKARRLKDFYQVHGHMAHKSAMPLKDKNGEFGYNLDSSSGQVLTGMHWPSKELFTYQFGVPLTKYQQMINKRRAKRNKHKILH